jgi:hypothetical protein
MAVEVTIAAFSFCSAIDGLDFRRTGISVKIVIDVLLHSF